MQKAITSDCSSVARGIAGRINGFRSDVDRPLAEHVINSRDEMLTSFPRLDYDDCAKDTALKADLSGTATHAPAIAPDFWFQGMRKDLSTGCYVMPERVYITPFDVWGQQDPTGYVEGANLYQFVGSNPPLRVDSFGTASEFGSWELYSKPDDAKVIDALVKKETPAADGANAAIEGLMKRFPGFPLKKDGKAGPKRVVGEGDVSKRFLAALAFWQTVSVCSKDGPFTVEFQEKGTIKDQLAPGNQTPALPMGEDKFLPTKVFTMTPLKETKGNIDTLIVIT